ncbi:cold shock protein (beta-ribbon, CspA family) [Chitinophaga terrae (ex Kim and Jung 2007)]|jgi:CspA family cold shock protein|uniref:Cold shock domain-containing protein n=2 Tax=Chitinophaga TaxID=79328 RepID=A0A3E1Y978_9BACT|nr:MULTISPECIES: cold shock domain-containing protein [Chitinophaga]MDQ0106664.1 CspA family cold shock protein [Chitinophaga terrae (ex Kim and Jung 2007)]RFS22009.1 cold shock domain-containing protein [Chitinophaga silvatica]SEA37378.1 cold shock protein (beta-ribbon, CspA family) [Chitinophaga terrae (ex Kim and Jung 2007)]
MQTGVVKFFNETKGFGFIKIEGSGQEIFVHVSGIKESISENDRVVFDIEEGRKGPNAVNVRLA